uniref:SPOC domain-containing protein n=1 Tax=Denticeps clupeoides TaxID=299321 RepID=A0AAY4BA06_9TELE
MKGKERSPAKKRSRAADEIRDRGKKIASLSASGGANNGNSSTKGGGGSSSAARRSLAGEKRDVTAEAEYKSLKISELGSQLAEGPAPKLGVAWQGTLLLKNSNFPSNMHLLDGDMGVAKSLLLDGSTGRHVTQLRITQRLRLDQPKMDEVSRRIKAAGPGGYVVLLAVPGGAEEPPPSSTQRPLRNLVSYLKQKQAAGVISLPAGAGVLHAFPPCHFSQQFLDAGAKTLAKTEEDYLVMVIVRGAS